MDEEISQSPVKKAAIQLRAMADKLERNDDGSFGGAVLILPPPNAGDPIETIILDANQDAGQFYVILQSKLTKAITDLDGRNRGGFGR